jgi:HTH-type transcriptional regulator/antitoxin HigA
MTANTVAQTAYERLLLEYAPRTIRSQSQYERVLRQIDQLMQKRKLTRAEDDLLELLSSLVSQYEQNRFPAADVAPAEVVAHLIESRGVTKAEVARATGIPRQTITHIVNGSRAVSKANRAKLAKYFHASPDLFLPAE